MRYWKRVDKDGETTTVESYSHDLNVEGAEEIDKDEFDAYIAICESKIPPPLKLRDLYAELDELKTKVAQLEAK